MALSSIARRRWVGAFALLAALGMLIAGQTVLQSRLEGGAFFFYWLVCFVFTFLAMLVALWDARALRYRSRQEERELLHNTLDEIISKAKARDATAKSEGRKSKG